MGVGLEALCKILRKTRFGPDSARTGASVGAPLGGLWGCRVLTLRDWSLSQNRWGVAISPSRPVITPLARPASGALVPGSTP